MWFGFQPERSGTFEFWTITTGPTLVLAVVALLWTIREELLREWLIPRGGVLSRSPFQFHRPRA
jgi:hypothetical protein